MSLLNEIRKKLLGQAQMDYTDAPTQGLIGTGGEMGGGLLNEKFSGSGNLFSNGVPSMALLGSAIYSQGLKGQDPFAALFPAYGQAQQIESMAAKSSINREAIKASKRKRENLEKLMESDLISPKDKMFLAAGLKIPENKTKISNFTKDAINAGIFPGSELYTQMFVQNYGKSKGLNMEFSDDGKLLSISQGGADIDKFLKKEGIKDVKLARSIQSDFGILQTNIKRLQSEIPNTPTGLYGNFVSGINVFADQFSQFKDFAIDSKFASRASKEAEEYLDTKGITKDAQQRAKVKSSIINLSYLLAKIAEPGNPKYSEGDIKRQLDRINWGGSRDQIMAGLQRILEEEYVTASAEFKKYNPEGDFGYDDPMPGSRQIEKEEDEMNNDPVKIRKK